MNWDVVIMLDYLLHLTCIIDFKPFKLKKSPKKNSIQNYNLIKIIVKAHSCKWEGFLPMMEPTFNSKTHNAHEI
jgi:hypothetical protein